MNFSSISVKRPVTTIMLLMIVVLLGVTSLMGIPMDLMPEMEIPVAIAMISYPNASPQEVETMITKPVEAALASCEGLKNIVSMTMAGSSVTMIEFEMDTDMNFATLDMREKIALIEGYLPANATDPMIMKMNLNSTPVVQVYVSGDMALDQLYNRVEDSVVSAFERASGVASVSVSGGLETEIAVTLDQERLLGYGLSLSTISQMLAADNLNMPSGNVEKGSTELIVRTIGEFESVEDIKRYPMILATGEVVRLGDIAHIEERYKDQDSISRIDGNTAIGVSIMKQSSANTVEVSKSIRKAMATLEKTNPDLTFTIGMDQADFIQLAVSSVAESAVLGGILAIVVVFLFLRNLGSTMIIAISIPTSFLATFVLMNYTGMTLNLLTLCGLTLGVGMLVDNSIVVLENVYSMNQTINDPYRASIEGSKQVFLSVVASTLTSVVVYLPIALSDGYAGMVFKDFCFTIIFALLASLVVSMTVVPMLCSKILTREVHTDYMRIGKKRYKFRFIPKFTKMIDALTVWYGEVITGALQKRKKTIVTCMLIFVVSLSLVLMVGAELLPESDQGMISISVEAPYGTSLEERNAMVSEMEEYLLTIPEVKHLSVDISSSSLLGGQSTTSTLSVTLTGKTERSRSTGEIAKEIKREFSDIAGADISVSETSMTSMMTGGASIGLYIYGDELEVLENVGNDLVSRFMEVDGISEASIDVTEGNPEIRVKLNRSVASNFGITAYQLANALESSLSGSTATNLKVDGNEIAINLSLNDTYGKTVDNMKQVMIPTPMGTTIPVGQVADFEFDNSPTVINRQNQVRVVTLSAYVEGRDLGSVSADINKVIESYPFPEGYYYDNGGQQEEMVDAFGQLGLALIVAILLVYMLLAAQFESLVLPLIVMIAVPFAMSGAFLALFFAGMRLSMISFTSLVILIGIVVNNAILLVEFIKINSETMGRDEAIIEAGRSRLRPILMTSLTTIVGMIPMSLGRGDGGEILAPMGVSIMGGLVGSTIGALLLVPVLYAWNDDRHNRRMEEKKKHAEEIAELERQWAMETETK
ncbi:MAG: efflux RND transporter permease subunit [Firmicutes bacterium]|nr:efflux RND transporter permease subunit [Bacillota bacterium]